MLVRNVRKTQNPVLLMIIFAILNGHRNGNDIPYKQFCWTSMLPVGVGVGTGCEWGIVQLTRSTGLEKSPDVICSQCVHMFSQWPNVFNHLMGNHWCFLERSLRHGNLRDDLSNKAHSTNEELEIYHHHGTKYLEISTNMALKKPHPNHIQYHPILPKGGLLMLFAYEHLYIISIQNHKLHYHPTSSSSTKKKCPEISRKYQL